MVSEISMKALLQKSFYQSNSPGQRSSVFRRVPTYSLPMRLSMVNLPPRLEPFQWELPLWPTQQSAIDDRSEDLYSRIP